MLTGLRRRLGRDEGFTLIELMVVVLIIGILIAIAIPSFLGARNRAHDRSAQASLRNTVTAAKAVFTDNEDYSAAVADANGDGTPNDQLTAGEPALTYLPAAINSTTSTQVSMKSSDAPSGGTGKHSRIVGSVMSDSGTCWYAQDVSGPASLVGGVAGTKWLKDDAPVAGKCNASAGDGLAYNDGAWKPDPGSAGVHHF